MPQWYWFWWGRKKKIVCCHLSGCSFHFSLICWKSHKVENNHQNRHILKWWQPVGKILKSSYFRAKNSYFWFYLFVSSMHFSYSKKLKNELNGEKWGNIYSGHPLVQPTYTILQTLVQWHNMILSKIHCICCQDVDMSSTFPTKPFSTTPPRHSECNVSPESKSQTPASLNVSSDKIAVLLKLLLLFKDCI